MTNTPAANNPFGNIRYNCLSQYCKNEFGHRLYKLSLNGGMTCPNRDGKIGYGGCIFCSKKGSGDFAADCLDNDINAQIEAAKLKIRNKDVSQRYIAYFQSYTNTYAPVDYLSKLFYAAISHEQVEVLSIATRPDCLPDDVISLLYDLNKIKPVWVELGLQTIHQTTADFIRRGYPTSCFDKAVIKLKNAGCKVIVHTILGLPFETDEMILQTMHHISSLPIDGIKLQLLHILENTDLGKLYKNGELAKKGYTPLALERYSELLINCIEHIRPDIVIHRITGDGAKKHLLAPKWSGNKRYVLNYISNQMRLNDSWQGKKYLS